MYSKRTISSEAIVLSRRNYGEADRIVTLFSKDIGKISVLARGVRKTTSKKRGAIEVFSRIKISYYKSDHGLPNLAESLILDLYENIRLHIPRLTLGYYVSEFVNKITIESEPNPEIYDALCKVLHKAELGHGLREARKDFIEECLVILGYWPEDKKLVDPDTVVTSVLQSRINSIHIGKKMLSSIDSQQILIPNHLK
jgi:DNA repair protein RecO (recombination protein O)